MTLLPIVDRELRVAARRSATHWIRFAIALVAVAVWAILSWGSQQSWSPVARGQLLFNAMAIPAFAYCLLAGVFLTADCLSSEKREQTLGLLFLTDLRGYDVVLGKLAASSLHGVYGALAVMPAMALPLLMGGVTGGQFWRIILVQLTTMFWSLSLGMAVSALVREIRLALSLALGLVAFWAGLPVVFYWLIKAALGGSFVDERFMLPSPAFAFWLAQDGIYQTPWLGQVFSLALLLMAGSGVALLALSCRLLMRQWRKSEAGVGRIRSETTSPPGPATTIQRQAQRANSAKLAVNPYAWLAQRDGRSGRVTHWLIVAGVSVWGAAFLAMFAGRDQQDAFIVSFCIAYGLHVVFKGLFAAEASRRLCEDRASGALELLLATPLSVQSILGGLRRALHKRFRKLVGLLAAMNLAYVWFLLTTNPMRMGRSDRSTFVLIFLGGALVLLLDVRALSWQSLLHAASGRKHHRAVLAAVGRLLLPFWIVAFVWIMMGFSGMLRDDDVLRWQVTAWFLAAVVYDWLLARQAKRRLARDFRSLVATGRSRKADGQVPASH